MGSKMGEKVCFKMYLKDSKHAEETADIRRFMVDVDVASCMTYVVEKIRSLIGGDVGSKAIEMYYRDDEDDLVHIDSDDELVMALDHMAETSVVKIIVVVGGGNNKEQKAKSSNNAPNGPVHLGVTCDGCESPNVRGFRFKCLVCPDFDLCSGCEQRGMHSQHAMMRTANASDVAFMPPNLMRRMQRMHNKTSRKAAQEQQQQATKDEREASDQDVRECPFGAPNMFLGNTSFRNRGRNCGNRRGFGSEFFGQNGPNGFGAPWSAFGRNNCHPVLDAVFKGWTGETEEVNQTNKMKSDGGHVKGEDESKKRSSNEGDKDEGIPEPNIEDFLKKGAEMLRNGEYLRNVGMMVAEILDPLGVDVQIDIENEGGQRTNIKSPDDSVSNPDNKKTSEVPKETKNEDIKVNIATKTTEKKTNGSEETVEITSKDESKGAVPKSSSSSSSLSVMTSETEADDWTLLNKASIPESGIPIPVVVSNSDTKKEEERTVSIEVATEQKEEEPNQKSLYPTLSEDTCKKEFTKREEEKKMEPLIEQAIHPNPRVQVALQAMLNMGFTNEGNWLAQLLEAKNGDIGKALDALQPNNEGQK